MCVDCPKGLREQELSVTWHTCEEALAYAIKCVRDYDYEHGMSIRRERHTGMDDYYWVEFHPDQERDFCRVVPALVEAADDLATRPV